MGKKIFHLVKLKDAKPCHVGQIKKVVPLCFSSTKVLTQTLRFIQVSNSHLERDSFLHYTYIYFK